MTLREEFEKSPRFRGMDFTRSATHPEYYESPYANGAWDGWQASRAALVIKLPEKCEYANTAGDYAKGHRQGKRDVVDCIEAAGVKVAL